LEGSNKKLIIIGVFLVAIALVLTPVTSFYPSATNAEGASGLMVAGMVLVVVGLILSVRGRAHVDNDH
jgi:protein-S-isoprenylcysteine O-methyltransferase Ste14